MIDGMTYHNVLVCCVAFINNLSVSINFID